MKIKTVKCWALILCLLTTACFAGLQERAIAEYKNSQGWEYMVCKFKKLLKDDLDMELTDKQIKEILSRKLTYDEVWAGHSIWIKDGEIIIYTLMHQNLWVRIGDRSFQLKSGDVHANLFLIGKELSDLKASK
jgi:hypothetical protein